MQWRSKCGLALRRFFCTLVQEDASAYASRLRECGQQKLLSEGRNIHAHILSSPELRNDRYIGNLVIEMYGKCGSVGEAIEAFKGVVEKNVFSWNIMITAYAQNGHAEEALLLFRRMQLDGMQPNSITFMGILNACSNPASFTRGKEIHALLAISGLTLDPSTGTALLNMYGKQRELDQARYVFDGMLSKDVIAWNAMISAYAHSDNGYKALKLFECMHCEGVKPNHVTFLSLVDACSSPEMLPQGTLLHQLVMEAGYLDNLSIANCLVDMYSKCGRLDIARKVFDSTEKKDLVSWNTMVSSYSQHSLAEDAFELFHIMLDEGPEPDRLTFLSILDSCKTLEQCKSFHDLAVERNIKMDVVLQTVLMNTYARCGSVEDARRVFKGIEFKDLVCWNSLLAAYAQAGYGKEALQVLRNMDLLGYRTNRISFMSAVEACGSLEDLLEGRRVHKRMVESGLGLDVVACSALVNMYGRCKSPEDARSLFQVMPERNVVTWTALIGALVDNDLNKEALTHFQLMDQEGVKPNEVTLVSTIDACANSLAVDTGALLHRRATQEGRDSNLYVGNSLINMYGKCGRLDEAKSVFDSVPERDTISWNALVSAYAQNGQGEDAVLTYRRMISEGVKPDRVTFISILDACATLGSVFDGKAIHQQAVEAGFESADVVLGTLVNMYGRCGSAKDAELVFGKLQRKDVISWNAVASALSQNGDRKRALQLLHGMDNEGVKPDNVTFITLLDTCADCNALVEGKQYHERALQCGFGYDVILGNALLNMYGKCGSLEEAKQVFARMPERNNVSWNTLIVAYAQNGHVRDTIDIFREMDLEGIYPNHVSFVTILFACSHAGLLEEGRKHFQYMTGDHGIVPTAEHYGCFIDLLGRTGRIAEAEDLIENMPVPARSVDWLILLGSSAAQENAQHAERAAENVVRLDDSKQAAPYLNLFNMYASG